MSDIHHWRRKIQPAFSHPLAPFGEQDETESHNAAVFDSSTRKKPRHKFTSYFSHLNPSSNRSASPSSSDNLKTSTDDTGCSSCVFWPEECDSDLTPKIESITRTLLTDPYQPLGRKHNEYLLLILESYRSLRCKNAELASKLASGTAIQNTAKLDFDHQVQRWQKEREEYKLEIERLELIIAQGQGGNERTVRARRGSTLHNESRPSTASSTGTNQSSEPRETLVEFLERTKVEDERKEQLAKRKVPLRRRPVSPSHKMAALSHTISKKSHYNDLPFASPPSPREFTSFAQASMSEILADQHSFSDNESVEQVPDQHRVASTTVDSSSTSANVSRSLPVSIPECDECYQGDNLRVDSSSSSSSASSLNDTDPTNQAEERVVASSFRRRSEDSQLKHIDKHIRNFSFDTGDYTESSRPKQDHLSTRHRQRSNSAFDTLPRPSSSSPRRALNTFVANNEWPSRALTPSAHSPRPSNTHRSVFDASFARPTREDSTSSYLTAIRAPSSDRDLDQTASRS